MQANAHEPRFSILSATKSEAVQDNPILVEVTRGALVESCHRGAVAIADADGRVLLALGDIDRPTYPRSAVKALQAIPLIESGAAAAFGLGQVELAIACASHSGEEMHIDTVRTLLAKAGLDEQQLACGAHWPMSERVSRDLTRAGRVQAPSTTTARASMPACWRPRFTVDSIPRLRAAGARRARRDQASHFRDLRCNLRAGARWASMAARCRRSRFRSPRSLPVLRDWPVAGDFPAPGPKQRKD